VIDFLRRYLELRVTASTPLNPSFGSLSPRGSRTQRRVTRSCRTIAKVASPSCSTKPPRPIDTVYRITDGDDPDWASWYASWLVDLSELPDILGARPIRSHLVHALVQLDRDYTAAQSTDPWEDWYPARLGRLLE
jgi:hypothetical protein